MAPKKQQPAAAAPRKARPGEKHGYRMKAVTKALRRLGPDAKPLQIQEYLKKKGLDMDPTVISNYKGTILKRMAAEGTEEPKAEKPPAPARNGAKAAGISVEDIRSVKDLVDRLGDDTVKGMIDVLGH